MLVLYKDCRCWTAGLDALKAPVDADHQSLAVAGAKPGRQGLFNCSHILRKMSKIFLILKRDEKAEIFTNHKVWI